MYRKSLHWKPTCPVCKHWYCAVCLHRLLVLSSGVCAVLSQSARPSLYVIDLPVYDWLQQSAVIHSQDVPKPSQSFSLMISSSFCSGVFSWTYSSQMLFFHEMPGICCWNLWCTASKVFFCVALLQCKALCTAVWSCRRILICAVT